MSRKKKDGRRATGVQSKKGMLYIVMTHNVVRDGRIVNEKKWIATGLPDSPENIRIAADQRARLSSGHNNTSIDRNITMSNFTDLYLERKKRVVSDSTYAGYRHRGMRIKKFFSEVRVRDVSQTNVEQFLDSLFRNDGSQPRTVKDIKVLFGSIMDEAVKEGLLKSNPVKAATINKTLAVASAKTKDLGEDFFSYTEAQRFLTIAETHPLYELFYVTLFFGLRREEVLGLRWSSVNFAEKSFVINHTVTKGSAGVNRLNVTKTESSNRIYPLNDDQIMVFRHLKDEEDRNRILFGNQYQDNDYIFKHPDGRLYYPDYPTKAFSKIIKAHPEELPQGITFHGLRSSCVSLLIHEGFDVKRVQKWVGHADPETTLKIYAKVKDKESKQEILSGMNEMIRPKKYPVS